MSIEHIGFNRRAISAGECVSKGWEILKPNYLVFLAIAVVIVILGCIPIISWFLVGPLLVGIQYAMLKQYRGEQADFGNLFFGFGKLIPAIVIGILFILPGILLNTYKLGLRLLQLLAVFNPNELTAGAAVIYGIFSFLINILAIVASILFAITFMFAVPLLADKDLSLMDTIKLSAKAGWANFGGLFLLILLTGLILLGGILALCIGIFFVLPIIYAANTVAYRQVFPEANHPGQPGNPPSPENYGNNYGQSM